MLCKRTHLRTHRYVAKAHKFRSRRNLESTCQVSWNSSIIGYSSCKTKTHMKAMFTYRHTSTHVESSASGSSLALDERKSAKAVMRFIINTSTCGQQALHRSPAEHGVQEGTQSKSKGSNGGISKVGVVAHHGKVRRERAGNHSDYRVESDHPDRNPIHQLNIMRKDHLSAEST